MPIFAIFHLWSFSYRPYVLGSTLHQQVYGHLNEKNPKYHGGPAGVKAFVQAFNPWDLVKAVGRSAKWLFVGRKARLQDPSYSNIDSTPVQKMNDLDTPPTSYDGSSAYHQGKPAPSDEGSRLLNSAQPPAQMNPYSTAGGDSSPTWTDVERKEYLQDQEMRRQQGKRDDFQTAHMNPYDTHSQQQTGVLRPAGADPYRRPQQISPQDQNLPMVTKQDIEDMQSSRHGAAPYPTSIASGNPSQKMYMPSVSQNQRPRGHDEDDFI